MERLLYKDVFISEVMDQVCLFPLPKTKFQRILELNNLTKVLQTGSPRDIQEHAFPPDSTRNVTQSYITKSNASKGLSSIKTSVITTEQPSRMFHSKSAAHSSHFPTQKSMSSSQMTVSPKRKVIFQEGGKHAVNQPLMVIESDRTSPMMRSVQS